MYHDSIYYALKSILINHNKLHCGLSCVTKCKNIVNISTSVLPLTLVVHALHEWVRTHIIKAYMHIKWIHGIKCMICGSQWIQI